MATKLLLVTTCVGETASNQTQLSDAIATHDSRSNEEQQELLADLLTVALTTTRIDAQPA